MENIVYDNIVFSLQNSGGISVLWGEMLHRLTNDDRFKLNTIEYCDANNNLFRKALDFTPTVLLSNKGLSLKRYLNNFKPQNDKHIFHSSYYRYSADESAINITTVHDFTYEYYAKGVAKAVHCWQKYSAIRHSEHIVCVSHNTRNDLLKFLPHIDPSKVSVIHNGVSDDFCQATTMTLTDIGANFAKNEFLLFVGARAGYKNFELAIKSAALSNKALIAVGGGELDSQEIIMIESLLGRNNFLHLRGISNTVLNILYNNALALLYPTLYEGFGIPVIEAQRAGCPVIATYLSSIPEIIGNTQIIIPQPSEQILAHYIKQLDADEGLRKKEITQGLKNAQKFSWDNTYDQLTKLYLSL